MNVLRDIVDKVYLQCRNGIFSVTKDNPKRAHELFVSFSRFLYYTRLDGISLNNSTNFLSPPFFVSNAAGFNKDAKIPPRVLKYLGFDRNVIGTVTFDSWQGNPIPTVKRYPKTNSMVNWEGLPGDGAEVVAERQVGYGNHGVPTTVNLMATPGKKGDAVLRDIEKTVLACKDLPYVDRFELNISCPNTHSSDGSIDARAEYKERWEDMTQAVRENKHPHQELDLKVSPDLSELEVDDAAEIVQSRGIHGLTTTNTTSKHNPHYIDPSPGKGGGSGDSVYKDSLRVQKLFFKKLPATRINAVGGLNTVARVQERLQFGAQEIQIYTPLIFNGPGFLREMREAHYKSANIL